MKNPVMEMTRAGVVGMMLLLATAHAVAAEPDVFQVRLEGLQTLSAESIHRDLVNLPEIYEAAHPTVDQSVFEHRVQQAVTRGMLASGFLDSRVQGVQSDPLTLRIHEGPRFRRGTVIVRGASAPSCDWIASQLLVASDSDEDAKPVWTVGKPANGTLFGGMHIRNSVAQRLSELGLNGADANVELVRSDADQRQELHIQLAADDAGFQVPPQPFSDGVEADAASTDASAEPKQPMDLAAELELIHRRLLLKPLQGVRYRSWGEELSIDVMFGEKSASATIEYQTHRRQIVLVNGELLVSMQDPRTSIRIPIPSASAVIYQQSSKETEKGKTMGLTLNGAFSSKKPDEPGPMGARFTVSAWKEWFPPELTERVEDDRGLHYSYQDHRLSLDSQGRFVELTGTDLEGRRLSLVPVGEEEVGRAVDAITESANPIELFIRDPQTDRRVVLGEIFQNFADKKDEDDEFHIPPAGGEKEVLGMVVLMIVNDGKFIDPDSMIGHLAKLYALHISGNGRTISERLAELQVDAAQGPITSAVLADLWARQGSLETALAYYGRSQSLAGDFEAVQHDMQTLVAKNNLVGRVCEQVDVKQWLQATIQLIAPMVEEAPIAMVQSLIESMPDATGEQERLDNARRLLTIAYELQGRNVLRAHVAAQIEDLQARQKRIAEKAEEKKKKR